MDRDYRIIWFNFTLATILWVSMVNYEQIRAYFSVNPLAVMLEQVGIHTLGEHDPTAKGTIEMSPQLIDEDYISGIMYLKPNPSVQTIGVGQILLAEICVDENGKYLGHQMLTSSHWQAVNQQVETHIPTLYFLPGISGNRYVGGCVHIAFLIK